MTNNSNHYPQPKTHRLSRKAIGLALTATVAGGAGFAAGVAESNHRAAETVATTTHNYDDALQKAWDLTKTFREEQRTGSKTPHSFTLLNGVIKFKEQMTVNGQVIKPDEQLITPFVLSLANSGDSHSLAGSWLGVWDPANGGQIVPMPYDEKNMTFVPQAEGKFDGEGLTFQEDLVTKTTAAGESQPAQYVPAGHGAIVYKGAMPPFDTPSVVYDWSTDQYSSGS